MSSWVENPNFQRFRGHSSEELKLDEAFLSVVSNSDKALTLFSLSEDCYQVGKGIIIVTSGIEMGMVTTESCANGVHCGDGPQYLFQELQSRLFPENLCQFTSFAPVSSHSTQVLVVDTKFKNNFLLASVPFERRVTLKGNESVLCHVETLGSASKMGEFGFYELTINDTAHVPCQLKTLVEPVNIYLPLLLIILIFASATFLWKVIKNAPKLLGKYFTRFRALNKKEASGDTSERQKKVTTKKRLKSLDTFRGISIIVMIFVNYGGGGYWFLDHATWNGLQIADLVFPWFMWIMGVCIPISVRSVLKRGTSLRASILNVIRRAVILFGLGVMLNTAGRGADMEDIRIFGVLQRFGVAYFVVTTCAILLAPGNGYQAVEKGSEDNGVSGERSYRGQFWDEVVEVTSLKFQWIIMLGAVATHLLITFFLPVPGCPRGYLGPGGIEDGGRFKGCAGGATGYIDRVVLGMNHIYQKPTSNHVYHAGPFDPEGILGCLLSVFQVFLGVQAGTILLYHSSHKARLTRWLIWCVATGVIGAMLSLGSKEDGWIPLNKNLWSLSFVMVTSCFAFFLLLLCYVLVDVKGWWSGSPFFYPGMNATIMYVGHSLAYNLFPWHWKLPGIPMNTHFISTIEALWGTGLWVVIALMLYRNKFFLSI